MSDMSRLETGKGQELKHWHSAVKGCSTPGQWNLEGEDVGQASGARRSVCEHLKMQAGG